ncbi:MAG: hypothetical protein RR585_06625 [Coprobacillus sp.]
MTITNYLKRIMLPIILTIVYLILINNMRFEAYETWIHFIYYISLARYLYYGGEFIHLFHTLYEKMHYFSFLKNVLITISISMIFGYLSRFIIGNIGSVGTGYLIPVDDQTMMIVWVFTLALLKPICDALVYHKIFVVLDDKKIVYITMFVSLVFQAITNMGSVTGGIVIFLMSIPPMISYYITKDITVSLTSQVLVNLANFISLYLFFI